jgi:hypothetical protein
MKRGHRSDSFLVEAAIAISCVSLFVWWNHRCIWAAEHFEQPAYTGIDYERLYAITTVFRRVLERPPTEAELQEYRGKLSLDPDFDIPALETELRQTPEFKRLVGIQKNSTLAEVDGVVSEQAIRGKLADIYNRITGQAIDDVTMDLLYSRYRHTNLSDAYITALIQQMANVPGKSDQDSSQEAGAGSDKGAAKGTMAGASSNAFRSGDHADASDGAHPTPGSGAITIEREWLKDLGLSDADINGGPSKVLARLRAVATSCRESDVTKDMYAKAKICTRERQRMLNSIGYDEGEPMGSWTMPKNRDAAVYDKARSDQKNLKASTGDSSLSGSLLPKQG